MSNNRGLTVTKSENFSQWYSQVVQKAELADLRYNVKGFVVFRPWAVHLMNKMFHLLENELQQKDHQPILFPALIPESNFKTEAEHVQGFLPEVFWVTEAGSGGEKLAERLALRPTSETAMYPLFALWIRSWRDLPFKTYQRGQVWRYEGKATRPFIRGREFYWVEAHNAFETLNAAKNQVHEDLETTESVIHQEYAIPFLFFQRPEHDKFAGAVHTYAADTLMPDGRVLQLPSTHLLGQNFAKAFNITFIDKQGEPKHVWQTCYGPAVSRMVAAIIGIHGDDRGLILPPKIAPIQVVIVPILTSDQNANIIMSTCQRLQEKLVAASIAVKLDDDETHTPGWKFNYWELKGVPLRIEIGPRDVQQQQLIFVRRDTGKKTAVKDDTAVFEAKQLLQDIQNTLKMKAEKFLNDHIYEVTDRNELKKILNNQGGLVKIQWCGLVECAEILKNETNGGVIRGTLYDKNEIASGNCVICGKKATQIVYVSKQY